MFMNCIVVSAVGARRCRARELCHHVCGEFQSLRSHLDALEGERDRLTVGLEALRSDLDKEPPELWIESGLQDLRFV